MSPRQELAERIANFICVSNLTLPYGGCVVKEGKYYSVLFCMPRDLDGEVRVYGPKFIQIRYTTRFGSLPHVDNRVFETEQKAINFLDLAFVKFDFNSALSVPIKESKQ
jgi:hypothetical protein